jgi:hypothetical protein
VAKISVSTHGRHAGVMHGDNAKFHEDGAENEENGVAQAMVI